MESSKWGRSNRLTNITAIVSVLLLSLLLLAYVGLGEAYRTYPKFEMDKFAAQGEIVKNSMQTFLLAGLPLEQFPGFSTLTQPILASNQAIAAIYVTDPREAIIFANLQSGNRTPILDRQTDFQSSKLQEESHYEVLENETYYRLSLVLRNKFETVGNLQIMIPKSVISAKINASFAYVPLAGGGLLVLYAGLVLLIIARKEKERQRWLNLAYILTFFVMAIVVIATLINLYGAGIQGKTEALANSLGQRLNVPIALGLDIADFEGLDQTFKNYQELNPDLSFIALTRDSRVSIHTDTNLVGTQLEAQPNHYEYDIQLNQPPSSAQPQTTTVQVGIPKSAVYAKLWRSVKNFLVLFVAAGFISMLFFNLIMSFSRAPKIRQARLLQQPSPNQTGGTSSPTTALVAEVETEEEESDFQLGLIRPYYFMAVFIEGLTLSFLPQYLRDLAQTANADESLVSSIFTVYFAAFVLSLIPAGRYAERGGMMSLLLGGALLTTVAFILMGVVTHFYAMFAIRAIAGVGQGLLFIGVQSYILEAASREQKTQGAAIIVFSYNGGMISGTAIGALLAVYMGAQGVFIIASITACLIFWYALRLIPIIGSSPTSAPQPRHANDTAQLTEAKPSFMQSVARAVKDFQFVQTILLIGIPAKAILTGVTIFALPLLLAQQNYAQEDIGQILMLYAAGVLISSRYVAPLADRLGKTGGILFFGTIGSGLGLILIGLMGWDKVSQSNFSFLTTLVLMAGMTTLGLAHGFIHAPIVTHISNTKAAQILGKSSVTSLYRFLERIGHVAGPIVVGQLLFFNQESISTMGWIGLALVIFSLIFALTSGLSLIAPTTRKSPST